MRVIEAAAERGLDIDVQVFPEGTKTSADAAARAGCALSAIAKSLVFMVGDRPVLVIAPGDHRVDMGRLSGEMGGGKARRASLDECRAATGFAAGGTPAFGHATDLPVLIDVRLRQHYEVWSAAGTPTAIYPIALDDLVRASGARWVDVAVLPE